MVQQTYSLSNIRFDLAFWIAKTCSYFPQSIWLCVQIRLTLFPFYRFLSTDFLSKMFHPIHNTILRSLFCKCNLLLLILSRKFGKIVFCQLREPQMKNIKKNATNPKMLHSRKMSCLVRRSIEMCMAYIGLFKKWFVAFGYLITILLRLLIM